MTQARIEDRALVEAWLKEPTWLEPVDEDRVAAIVHQTPQVRRWPQRLDLGRFAAMLNATKFVAASVILALTGGLLLTTLPTEPSVEPIPAAETAMATVTPTPRATTAANEPPTAGEASGPTITLPDELPEGSQRGTIETPAGPLEWARLPVSDDVPRHIWGVAPWGEGLAVWADGSGLFATNDGIEWETLVETPSRPEAQQVPRGDADQRWGFVDGMHVVIDASGDRVWIGDAERGMRLIDSSAASTARMDGWTQRGRGLGGGPMLVDGRIVFTLAMAYRLPYRKLEIPLGEGTNERMKPLGDGRYALCGSGGGPGSCKEPGEDAEWILRFKATPGGLAVINDRSGERIGFLEGASPDDIYEGWQGQRHRIFAIEGDTVVEIDSPWPELDPRDVSRRIVAPGGSTPVLAYWEGDSDGPSTTQGLPVFASELPEGNRQFRVAAFPDRLYAETPPRDDGLARAWVSTDGIDWVGAPADVPEGAVARWIGSGWLAYDDWPDGPTRFWMHLGGEWVALDAAELPWIFSAAGYGDVTFVTGGGPRGRAVQLWVLTHPTSE